MWSEQKRLRFQELRKGQETGALTCDEETELSMLTCELDAAEECYLAAAVQRLRLEREAVDSQTHTLAELAARKESLVRRLRDFLAEAKAERQAIEGELAAVLSGNRGPQTDE